MSNCLCKDSDIILGGLSVITLIFISVHGYDPSIAIGRSECRYIQGMAHIGLCSIRSVSFQLSPLQH
ncbi:MAG TPA: hypothetical protein PKC30_07680 [Saprospiraceae bacterium]|nr:hypothetical protein [Saprospiraceae bacterium]